MENIEALPQSEWKKILNTWFPNNNGKININNLKQLLGYSDNIELKIPFVLHQYDSWGNMGGVWAIPIRDGGHLWDGQHGACEVVFHSDYTNRWLSQETATLDTCVKHLTDISRIAVSAYDGLAKVVKNGSACRNKSHIGSSYNVKRVILKSGDKEYWCMGCRDVDADKIVKVG